MAASIFISYRRTDVAAIAGRLHDHLVDRFGADHVFMDVDDIEPGQDFSEVILARLRECSVVLVLIGPQWLQARNPNGTRRIDDPQDLVHQEVATALRSGSRVIPVCVSGASVPLEADLPGPLRALVRLQALELRDGTAFKRDLQPLISTLQSVFSGDSSSGPKAPSKALTGPASNEAIGAATVITLLGGFAGPVALHASPNKALLLWSMASVCAGLIIGKPRTTVAAIVRASALPGTGHAIGALGTVFFVWASTQLGSVGPTAANIPLGGSGASIDMSSPKAAAVILLLSLATSVGSWILIGATAASAGLALPTMADEDASKLKGLESLRKWAAVIAATIAAAVAVASALER